MTPARRSDRSVIYPLILVIIAVFVVEFLIMLVLTGHTSRDVRTAIIDGSILIVVLFPVIFFAIYRPMVLEIRKREEIEDLRDRYLQGISHDLRTPLTAIQLKAEIIASELERARVEPRVLMVKKMSGEILRSVQRIQRMIDELIESAQLESGQTVAHPQIIALRPFLTELLGRMRETLNSSNCRLDLADSKSVVVDPTMLERILINLISNATKYSPSGQEIRIFSEESPTHVTLSVEDRGMGIPEEELPHIFTRFYRGSGAQGREGIGLGLHITKILVEANGGRIWVRSKPGAGSVFSFTVPVARN